MPFLIDHQLKTSIDLRLGSEFILMRKGELATLILEDSNLKYNLGKYYERVYVPLGRKFVLHPQELVLGGTLEYIRMPSDLLAYVVGRSSWGRLGLIIATATLVHPTFKGCLTLELTNHGNIPIELYPGLRIAQLVFHNLTKPEQYSYLGKYSGEEGWVGPTSPGFSKIHEESEIIRLIQKLP